MWLDIKAEKLPRIPSFSIYLYHILLPLCSIEKHQLTNYRMADKLYTHACIYQYLKHYLEIKFNEHGRKQLYVIKPLNTHHKLPNAYRKSIDFKVSKGLTILISISLMRGVVLIMKRLEYLYHLCSLSNS